MDFGQVRRHPEHVRRAEIQRADIFTARPSLLPPPLPAFTPRPR